MKHLSNTTGRSLIHFFKTEKVQAGLKKMLRNVLAPFLVPIVKIAKRRAKNNVCIFHNGRCGSTVISHLLGKHGKIHWDGEIYSKYFLKPDGKTFGKVNYERDQSIRILKNKMKAIFTKYYGFDVKRNHIEWFNFSISDYIEQLKELGFDRFIVLERQNHLRTILSYTIAREMGIWHIHRHEAAVEKTLRINPEKVYLAYEEMDLLNALELMSCYYRDLRNALKDLNVPYLDVTYEKDIRENPMVAYKKIIEYLGLRPKQPKIRFNRTNPFPLSKMVSNYDELDKYLSKTPYAWMLEG